MSAIPDARLRWAAASSAWRWPKTLPSEALKTTIVEMLDQVMPTLDYEMAALLHEHLEAKNVELELENGVKSFSKAGNRILVSTQKGRDIECDMVLLSVGIRPENKLAKQADLKIGPTGGIAVDDTMRTSDPNIYAVGDAVEVRDLVTGFPTLTALAGPANKQARIAARQCFGQKVDLYRNPGEFGGKSVRYGRGIYRRQRKISKKARHSLSCFLHALRLPCRLLSGRYPNIDQNPFFPGHWQGAGRSKSWAKKGVDKRIDVLATAIRAEMTVYDTCRNWNWLMHRRIHRQKTLSTFPALWLPIFSKGIWK